jgi:hypothetical protein
MRLKEFLLGSALLAALCAPAMAQSPAPAGCTPKPPITTATEDNGGTSKLATEDNGGTTKLATEDNGGTTKLATEDNGGTTKLASTAPTNTATTQPNCN